MAKDWLDVKSNIYHFYVVQGLQLDEVIRRVAADEDFSASPRQYLKKLEEWGYEQSPDDARSNSREHGGPVIYGRRELTLLSESFRLDPQDHCPRNRPRRYGASSTTSSHGICKSCSSSSTKKLRSKPISGSSSSPSAALAVHATPGAVMGSHPTRSGSSDDYAWGHGGGSSSSYHDDSASDSGTGMCRRLEDVCLREHDQSSTASSSGREFFAARPQPPHAAGLDEQYGGWI